MPNLEETVVLDGLSDASPDRSVCFEHGIRPVEQHDVVKAAIEALGADLDDAHFSDPQGFHSKLEAGALSAVLCQLLSSLGAARVLSVLDWMARTTARPNGPRLIASFSTPAELIAFVEGRRRRHLFDKLLSPARLAELLAASAGDRSAEAG